MIVVLEDLDNNSAEYLGSDSDEVVEVTVVGIGPQGPKGSGGIETVAGVAPVGDDVPADQMRVTLGIDALQESVDLVDDALDTEISDRSIAVSNEAAARTAADADLAERIDLSELDLLAEQQQREDGDAGLGTAINAEVQARSDADADIIADLNAETTARTAADSTLQANIDAEATTRANADTALSGRITTLENTDYDEEGSAAAVQAELDTHEAQTTGAHNLAALLGAKADLVGGKIPSGQLPAIAITDTFPVANQAEMLALVAERGDVAVRSDDGRAYILQSEPAGTLANWIELSAPGVITSVNGQTGVVVLTATDVGAASTGELDTETAARIAADSDLQDQIDNIEVGGTANIATIVNLVDGPRVIISAVEPVSPQPGDYWFESLDAMMEAFTASGGAVDSVNGQTGDVVLDAADVGADPAGTASGLVDAEATTRANADTAEQNAREAADNSLQTAINGKVGTGDARILPQPSSGTSGQMPAVAAGGSAYELIAPPKTPLEIVNITGPVTLSPSAHRKKVLLADGVFQRTVTLNTSPDWVAGDWFVLASAGAQDAFVSAGAGVTVQWPDPSMFMARAQDGEPATFVYKGSDTWEVLTAPRTAQPLTEASDTDLYDPLDGQMIAWSTADELWVLVDPPAGGGGGVTEFADLTDVDWTTPPTEGQVFAWDDVAAKLVPVDPAAGAVVSGYVYIFDDNPPETHGNLTGSSLSGNAYAQQSAYVNFHFPVAIDSISWVVGAAGSFELLVDDVVVAGPLASAGDNTTLVFTPSDLAINDRHLFAIREIGGTRVYRYRNAASYTSGFLTIGNWTEGGSSFSPPISVTGVPAEFVAASGGTGTVESVVPGTGIDVDATDPANPVVSMEVDLAAAGKGFVAHGAVAGTARPGGFVSIEWFGTVEPLNWIDGDTWINPAEA